MINHEPDNMVFDKINIKLNGILRQLRQSEPEFTMQYLAAETDYEMIVSITADGISSDESGIIKFKTPKAKTALNLKTKNETGGSWIAGIITGIALIVICVIIFVFVSKSVSFEAAKVRDDALYISLQLKCCLMQLLFTHFLQNLHQFCLNFQMRQESSG